jgi:hypothetical protein
MNHARRRATACATAPLVVLGALALSCGGSGKSSFGDGGVDGSGGDASGRDTGTTPPTDSGFHLGTDSGDSGSMTTDTGPPPMTAVVYAESPNTLYQLDPTTNAISVVAPFSGDCAARADCSDVIDIALDEMSNGYATTFGALYSFDPKTAVTKFIHKGPYPNSLSFVPKGTLDPAAETLVGYDGAVYIKIDTTTGIITPVGKLTGGYTSSGDIVSVIGGGTFLTVKGVGCGDCLLQVDPKTGDIIQNYGSVNHASVFGLAFWGGVAYGFDDMGVVFSITFPAGKLTTNDIPIPGMGPGQFYGAGSTTSAPPTQADGGGIPIK